MQSIPVKNQHKGAEIKAVACVRQVCSEIFGQVNYFENAKNF